MSAPTEYRVSIGQPCTRCKRDDWLVKRAFKICQCGQKCWTRQVVERTAGGPAMHYKYHQGDAPPPDAVVLGPTRDTPYRGPGSARHGKRTKRPLPDAPDGDEAVGEG